MDTSAVDYFYKDTISEPFSSTYYGELCEDKLLLKGISNSTIYIGIEEESEESMWEHLYDEGYIDRIKSLGYYELEEPEPDYMNQTSYIIVADSSNDYYALKESMMIYSNSTGIEVDSMGRIYDYTSHTIKLPLDSPDEIYAGSFYPRRYPGNHLSIEPLSYYTNKNAVQFGIIILITNSLDTAETVLKLTKANFPRASIIRDDIYMGCMH